MRKYHCAKIWLLFFPLLAAHAEASELRLRPSIAVSEEFNDNIRETREGERVEYVTRVQPGAALQYQVPHLALDAGYTLDYRHYARHTSGDEFNHAASVRGALRSSEDFFIVEFSESYTRVSLDLARETVQESVLVDQTDTNIATVSPYLNWRLGDKSVLKTGYRFSDIRYWHSSAIDKQVHAVFAEYLYRLSERLDLNAALSFSATETAALDYQEQRVSAGFRYQYREGSFLYGNAGNSWLEFSNDESTSNPFWNAGVTHAFGMLVATLESTVQYSEDPLTLSTKQTDYTARLDRTLERGRLWSSAGYSEFDEMLEGTNDRDRYQLILGGSHELTQGLTAGVTLLGERSSRSGATYNLPYHLVATASLNYTMKEGTTLGGTYSHISYRDSLGSSTGSIEANRVIVEARKTF